MPKPLHPMWAYGEPIDPHNRQKLNCKLCGKEIYGGISHLKYQLAKIGGHEVDVCSAVAPKVMCIANQSLLDMAKKRDEKEELRVELASKTQSRSMRSALGMGEMHSFSSSTHTTTSTMPLTSSLFFVPRSTPWGQSSILSLIKSKKEEADKLVEKCFIWGDIPFNIAKNNPF